MIKEVDILSEENCKYCDRQECWRWGQNRLGCSDFMKFGYEDDD